MTDQDFVQVAEEMIAEGRMDEASAVLKGALDEMPTAWSPIKDEARFLRIAFWDREEFFAYLRIHKNSSKSVLWVRGSYSKALYILSALASKQGRLTEALDYAERGLQLEGDHPELWSQKGVVLGKQMRHHEALDCYAQAATIRPWAPADQVARALRGQGVQLVDLNRLDEAEDALRRSLEYEPDSELALKELEYIDQQRTGPLAEPRLPWFLHALLNPPKDPRTKQMLAEVEGLPLIPGPKTVGSENYSRIAEAFMTRGWEGFEVEFDQIVPRTRPDYDHVKRYLLREPIFSPKAHRDMARAFAAGTEGSEESLEDVLNEIYGDRDDSLTSEGGSTE